MEISDIRNAWRSQLVRASFRNCQFHCESNAREGGRRIVEHEFPKKEFPYAEDMGKLAMGFAIRGYIIVYPRDIDNDQLRRLDYRIARDALRNALEEIGPGELQLPTQHFENVVCTHYRLVEEEKFGGYCVFDMTFQEFGVDPEQWAPSVDTAGAVNSAANDTINNVNRVLSNPTPAPPLTSTQNDFVDITPTALE